MSNLIYVLSCRFRLFKGILFKPLFCSLCLLLLLSPAAAFAQPGVVVDSAAHANNPKPPTVEQIKGVEMLNIAAPSAGGVSHNKLLQLNVNERGLILNNLTVGDYSPDVKSVLVGQNIGPNTNLGNSYARIILNEVTGTTPSQLKGYTEIYGRTADYILANPNGIVASGAGFINVNRLTMITGKPHMENGEIRSFTLSPVGIIKIENGGEHQFGLHIGASKAELVANMIKIAGSIYALGALELKTGDDTFDYKTGEVTSKPGSRVEVAVDSIALGGMYAGSIRIHASQTGMGVNIGSDMLADTSDIEITADGNIAYKDAAAAGNIRIASANNDVKQTEGFTFAVNKTEIKAGGNIILDGDSVISQNVILISGKDIVQNRGFIFADKASLTSGKDITLQGDYVYAKKVNINAGADFVLDGALVGADDTVAISGTNIIQKQGAIQSVNLLLNAGNNINLAGDYVYAMMLEATAAGNIRNETHVHADSLLAANAGGNIINIGKFTSGEKSSIRAANVDNYGQFFSIGSLDFNVARDFTNYRDSAVLSGGHINFAVGRNLVNYRAEIYAGGHIFFKGQEGYLATLSDQEKVFSISGNLAVLYDNPYVTDQGLHSANSGSQQQGGGSSSGNGGGGTGNTDPNTGGNTGQSQNSVFDQYMTSLEAYATRTDAMNVLANIGGRIESGGSIGINSTSLINMGVDFNTGKDAATTYYHRLRARAENNAGWQELGRYVVDEVRLDAIPALIIAGGNLGIYSQSVLNRSSTLAAYGNMYITADSFANQTYSEQFRLAIYMEKRTRERTWYGRAKTSTDNRTDYYTEQIYSKAPALVTAGSNIFIKAGTIINDKAQETKGFHFGRDPQEAIDAHGVNSGIFSHAQSGVAVSYTLPRGTNGMFRLAEPNSRYMVVINNFGGGMWSYGGEFLLDSIRYGSDYCYVKFNISF